MMTRDIVQVKLFESCNELAAYAMMNANISRTFIKLIGNDCVFFSASKNNENRFEIVIENLVMSLAFSIVLVITNEKYNALN